ncbi:MAG: hypothetical protein WCH98_19790 [Verrucomicrobiota bacterium]
MAEQKDPQLFPFLALSFFAGIRLSEMQRLDWTAVDLKENFVRLPASITKTKQTRHIDFPENLTAWLDPYAKTSGAVVPCSPDVPRNRMTNRAPAKLKAAEGFAGRSACASFPLVDLHRGSGVE